MEQQYLSEVNTCYSFCEHTFLCTTTSCFWPATRTRFKLYFYIRPLDLLFRSPSFQFRGGTKTSLTALVVLYSVLNMDYRGFYKRLLGTKGVCCGWAEALRLSGASFRNSVLVQKKNNTPPCSGASSEQNTPNRDPYVKVLLSQMQYAKRVKRDSDWLQWPNCFTSLSAMPLSIF